MAAVDDAPGLRERKKQQTREAIASAALDLFGRFGFHATTLKQIAEVANVAPRTVSLYFPAKEELVFGAYDELFDAMQARLTDRRPGETAADALGAFLHDFARGTAARELERSARIRELVEREPALRAFERGIQERAELIIADAVAVDLGLEPDDLLPAMVGAATMAVLDALGRRVKEGERFVEEAGALIDEAMAFIGAGVRELAGRGAA